jgi:hypothetical protein
VKPPIRAGKAKALRALATVRWAALLVTLSACSPSSVDRAAGPANAAAATADVGRPLPMPDGFAAGPASPRSSALANAAAATRLHDEISAALQAHLQILAARGQPRDRLDIALLLPLLDRDSVADPALRRDALALARDAPGHRALVAWLEAIGCIDIEACDASVARLQQLEPDNAAAWLLALELQATAQTSAREAESQLALLKQAARASRYDDHLADASRETLRALQPVHWPPLDRHGETAVREMLQLPESVSGSALRPALMATYATAMDIPPYRATDEACAPDTALRPGSDRLGSCRAVMSLMADGDSLIAQVLGTTRMVRLTPDGPEAAHWRERLRQSHWLRAQWPKIGSPALSYAIREQGEVPAVRAELERRGLALPPAGWLPEQPRARSLILTGRLPPDS